MSSLQIASLFRLSLLGKPTPVKNPSPTSEPLSVSARSRYKTQKWKYTRGAHRHKMCQKRRQKMCQFSYSQRPRPKRQDKRLSIFSPSPKPTHVNLSLTTQILKIAPISIASRT